MRIFRFLIITTELLICFLLESMVAVHLPFHNIVPDLLVIIVVGCGWMFGSNQGMLYGFIAGLLIDFSSDTPLGFAAVLYVLIGFFAGLFRKFYKRSDCVTPLIIVAFTEIVYMTFYYLINFLTKGHSQYSVFLQGKILPRVTLTVLLAVFIYKLFQLSLNWTKRGEIRK